MTQHHCHRMKIAAVNSRGTKRDFVDLYCLQDIITLDELFELIPEKYANRPNVLAIATRALSYHEDAEQQQMPDMLRSVKWSDVKSYCTAASNRLVRHLNNLTYSIALSYLIFAQLGAAEAKQANNWLMEILGSAEAMNEYLAEMVAGD